MPIGTIILAMFVSGAANLAAQFLFRKEPNMRFLALSTSCEWLGMWVLAIFLYF